MLKKTNKEAEKRNTLHISVFYLHSMIYKQPLSTWPIISVSGSTLLGLCQWVDLYLQDLIQQHPTVFPFHIESSTELLHKIKNLDLPPGCQLFTANAISMYTNIETVHALAMFTTFFTKFPVGSIFPGLLPAIKIIMRHCVFTFDNRF